MTFRIFLSFDLEHDRDLCERMLESSGSQRVFEVSGRSQGGALSDTWLQRTHGQIAGADQFVVVCGEHSDESERLAAELRIAQEQEKPVILLWSRREVMCKKPAGASPNDNMYSWTPDILREQLVANQRKALPDQVPDRLKRQQPPARTVED